MAESLEERLRRLLLLVPYVIKGGSVSVDDIRTQFDITRKQLIADLELLFLCGRPGYGPGDLIEADLDGEYVVIRMAEFFSKPLRLTPGEGLVLYTGTQALSAAGLGGDALARALKRLEESLGPQVLGRVKVGIESPGDLGKVREALIAKKRIHAVYQSRGREEETERDIDPWVIFVSNGRWYLAGWCHLVDDERMFRIDRMRHVEILDTDANIPDDVDPSKYEGVYVEGPNSQRVVLDIARDAAYWVTKYYPLQSQRELSDGWVRIELTAGGTAWVGKLLLRLGSQARIVEPKELALRVRETACALLDRYREAG